MEDSCRTKETVHKSNSDPGQAIGADASGVGEPAAAAAADTGDASGATASSSCRRHRSASSHPPHVSRKCVLTFDGYSYVIVASSPDKGAPNPKRSSSGGGSERRTRSERTSLSSSSSSPSSPSPSASSTATATATATTATPTPTPTSTSTSTSNASCEPPTENKNVRAGQLCKQGSLTIVRRSSTKKSPPSRYFRRGGSVSVTDDEALDEIDLNTENLPAVDTPDACDKAAIRLRCLLRQLQKGQVSADLLRRNLQYAAKVLEAVFIDETKRLVDEDDELSEVQPDAVPPEVREWLASTFTRQLATCRRKTDEKPKFRSVAHAIRAGIFVDRMYRRVTSATIMQFPDDVVRVLKTLDEWSFDIFDLSNASSNQPLKYLGYDLLNRYGMFHKFKVPPPTVEYFLTRIEEGYCRFVNPYHNNLHAADVAQSIHWMLLQTGLMHWLTDLEIFATLIAAIVHDFEHTGTTNNFHVMSGSDKALLYNDRAVLENHHISATFRLIKEDECNILQHLSREEYREFRTLVIDMVLATDMSFHFQQLKNMRNLLTIAEPFMDKSKALSLVLHCCDISHPAKRWDLHHQWTERLLEEFFRQGDEERKLGLPFSPLCDRNNTLVAESQIGFIDFIVEPSMAVCGDMLEVIASVVGGPAAQITAGVSREFRNDEMSACDTENARIKFKKPWVACLAENKRKWKEQAAQECEARSSCGDSSTDVAREESKSCDRKAIEER